MIRKFVVLTGVVLVLLSLAVSPLMGETGAPRQIPLQSGAVDLEKGIIDLENGGYAVVQFEKRLKQEDFETLRILGVNALSFLYKGAWLCAVAPSSLDEEVIERFGITAVKPWEAEYKISPELRKGKAQDWAVTGSGKIKLLVTIFEDVSRPEMERLISKYDPSGSLFREPNVWAVQVSPHRIERLIHEEPVHSVEEGPRPFEPLCDKSRALIRVDEVQGADLSHTPPLYQGLSGEGVNIAVSETVYTDHPDFWNHDFSGNETTPRFLNTGYANFHGTHVAGIIGGNGWNCARDGNTGSPYQWRGMAPEATLISNSGYGTYPVHASNHSYVMEYGAYQSTARGVDLDIRGGRGPAYQRPHIWAAANQGFSAQYNDEEGYYSIYSPAKNSICVGAVNGNDGSLAAFSSLGPTFDGRIKPDVMAAGANNTMPRDWEDTELLTVHIDYIRIMDGEKPLKSWEFDNLDGWFAVEKHEIHEPEVSDGVLTFKTRPGGYGFVEDVNLVVTPAWKINFQPAWAEVPDGYLVDSGQGFGDRGNGSTYGWNKGNYETRDRNSEWAWDQRHDTLNHMQKPSNRNASWEIAVPNGPYRVSVVAGDPDYIDSVYHIDVEGEEAVYGEPGEWEHWFDGTVEVEVTDGRLSVTNGSKARNNKICFIEIESLAPANHTIQMKIKVDNAHPAFEMKSLFWWTWAESGDYVDGNLDFDVTVDNDWKAVTLPVSKIGREVSPWNYSPMDLNGWRYTIKRLRIDPLGGSRAIMSTWSVDGAYIDAGGTSMAAPAVTGTVALLLQQFVQQGKFVGDGWEPVDLNDNPPLPSTVKAILVHTAEDLVHTTADKRDPNNPDTDSPVLYDEGPDFATGYGLVNAEAAARLVEEAAADQLITERALEWGTHEYFIHVPHGAGELKLTLAWDDVEGSTTLDQRLPRLVNDLDLVLVDPEGRMHYPWTLDPPKVADCGGSGPGCGDRDPISPADIVPARKGPDHRNNVEVVQVSSPRAGRWTVRVSGDGIQDVSNGPQAYSLVSSEPLEFQGLKQDLEILQVSTGKDYGLDTASVGAAMYIDRSYTITGIGKRLENGFLVQTANDDKKVRTRKHLLLRLNQDADVYVCYDRRAFRLPRWLERGSWRKLPGEQVRTTDVTFEVYRKFVRAGDLWLGGNWDLWPTGAQSNYFVVVKPLTDRLVDVVRVSTGRAYSVAGARQGARMYIDRSYTITGLSELLEGGSLVMTANNDKRVQVGEHLLLHLNRDADVFVCYDERATHPPAWLGDGTWIKLYMEEVQTTDVPFGVYWKPVPAGDLWLGGNWHGGITRADSNYFVIVQP